MDVSLALRLARSDIAPRETVQPPGAAPELQVPAAPPRRFRARLKQKLRTVAALAFRRAKPWVRPAIFRFRAYMAAPLLAEMQRHHQESRQLFLGVQAAGHQAGALQASLDSRLAESSLQVIQELQYTRDALRSRIDALASEVDALRGVVPALARIEQYSHASARRVALPCGDDEVLVRTDVGFVVCPASNLALLAALLEGGELQPGIHSLIGRLAAPGGTFVDIGANLGLHTLAACLAMQGKGRLVAFEHHPDAHRLLRKTLQINGFGTRVEVRQSQASDRADGGHDQAGADARPASGSDAQATPPHAFKLERVDDVVPAGTLVDLIRFDASEAGLESLAGGRATVERSPDIALIVAFGAAHLQKPGESMEDWRLAGRSLGLEAALVDGQSGLVSERIDAAIETPQGGHLLLTRADSLAWTRALVA